MNIDDLAKMLGNKRTEMQNGSPSQRLLVDGSDHIGFMGEMLFALRYGLRMNLDPIPGGDPGYDFTIPLNFTVDIKTTKTLGNLLVEKGKVKADIYVMYYFDGKEYTPIGWEWGKVIEQVPPKDFGKGVINHFISHDKLKPMSILDKQSGITK